MFQEDYFNVSWETHSEHVKGMLHEMRTSNDFTDVTIICSDQIEVNAHRNILSAFSPTFRRILLLDKCMNNNNPVIYLRGIQSEDIEPILQFIYLGETTIQQNRVQEFLTVAKELEIKDLVNILDASGTVLKKEKNELLRNVQGNDTFPPKYQNEENNESYLGWLPLRDTFENVEDSGPTSTRRQPDRSSLKVMKKRHACDQCEFRSNVKERLQRHIQSEHEPPVKYSWGVGVVWKQ